MQKKPLQTLLFTCTFSYLYVPSAKTSSKPREKYKKLRKYFEIEKYEKKKTVLTSF